MRAVLFVFASLSFAGLARAEAPRVIDARLEAAPAGAREPARRVLAELVGQPADRAAIAAAVQAVGGLDGVGGVSVDERAVVGGVALVFRSDGRRRRVGDVAWLIDGLTLEAAAGWRLHRRIDAGAGLYLAAGERFHPHLMALDEAAVAGWHRDRGYRDVRVEAAARLGEDLATVVFRVDRGARYRVAGVRVTGLPAGVEAPALRTATDEALSAADLAADRAAIGRALCAAGFPRATVAAEEAGAASAGEAEDGAARRVAVRFVAEPGPRLVVGRVQIVGRWVPWPVQAVLPLQEGDPYCPAGVEAARRRVADFLRDRGVPDPQIAVSALTFLRPDGQRVVGVTFDIRRLADARVERVWFSGNRVTREDVLRQLTAIGEGDLYRQAAVDASVQAMRRSGLFRRVSAQVIEGSRPDRVFLTFELVEQEAIGFDVTNARLILRNLDLTAWPEDFAAFEEGRAFRGAGQRIDLIGQPDLQSLRWRDGFVSRHVIAEVAFARQTVDNAGFEAQWLTLRGGPGLKGDEGAASVLVFGEVEWTSSAVKGGAALPVLDDDRFTAAGGLDGRLDWTRRDDERVQYLGVELSLTGRVGGAIDGAELGWVDTLSRLRLHLPVWSTARGQHGVLRLTARNRAVVAFRGREAALPAHRRLFPAARGYGGTAVGLDFDLPEGETLRLGGLHAADASAELRIPLPFGRRNAVSPFVDAASVADSVGALRDDIYPSVGLAVAFSLFRERLEGVLWGAWPLREEAAASYVGGSLGGNF
ncbi:MAG: BamA/TamA family outer membrane protein [Myxococcales bacterium]|nr:BamA/TamA family outer membrane protein [Myxococcales bacterium]